jgi:Zn-dependent protease
VLVAGAGPASNILLAVLFKGALYVGRHSGARESDAVLALLCTLGLFVGLRAGAAADDPATLLLDAGIRINVVLALFNLVPLPPLDGSWIASWGLPRRISEPYDRIMQPYGTWILLALFATGLLGRALLPFTSALYAYLSRLAL